MGIFSNLTETQGFALMIYGPIFLVAVSALGIGLYFLFR